MVQLSPITKFGSGAGYEYENTVIYAFAHTNKGHWNLCNIPVLPVSGTVNPDDFGSSFSHKNESAHPGYYQVYLERYHINAELTSTLRTAFHRYTYDDNRPPKKLIVNLAVSNEKIRDWKIEQEGENAFSGYQTASEKVFFYAVSNYRIKTIERLKGSHSDLPVVDFTDGSTPLEIRIGLSFVSTANAKQNLEKELAGKTFETVKAEASAEWESLLSKIQVSGGTERQRMLFYSCLYRSFLWPALRSDVNGEYTDANGAVAKADFQYYTLPSLWDDYRNKLVLLGMLSPNVTTDVIRSLIDRGEKQGSSPRFFMATTRPPSLRGPICADYAATTFTRRIACFCVTQLSKVARAPISPSTCRRAISPRQIYRILKWKPGQKQALPRLWSMPMTTMRWLYSQSSLTMTQIIKC